MIECYYRWCTHHEKDEPICCEEQCRASESKLRRFAFLRRVEKIMWEADRKVEEQKA